MSRSYPGLNRARLLVIPACVALTSIAALTVPATASAQVAIDIFAPSPPPPLVVYEQPALPAPGYIWTPGFWSYGDYGYYWVPGTWVEPPSVGLLWTPGYWGFANGRYGFNAGYWGPHVGFYGGINYGFGYGGDGYEGGFWRGGAFSYNRSVNNFGGVHVTNVYNKTVVNNVTVNRVSYNGPGGVTRAATPQEQQFAHEQHVQPTAMQVQHREIAAKNPDLRDSVNHGHPAVAATSRPTEFPKTPSATHEPAAARHEPAAATHAPEAARPGEAQRGMAPEHAEERAPAARPGAPEASHTAAGREVPRATTRTPAEHTATKPEAAPREARPEHAAVTHERPAAEPAAARRVEPQHAPAPPHMARPAAPPHAAPAPHPEADDKGHH